MSSEPTVAHIPYGNFTRPRRDGILGLPVIATAALVPLVILLIAMMANQWFLEAVILVVASAATMFLLLGLKIQGRSFAERQMLRGMHRVKTRQGNHLYLPGPAGKIPNGTFTLPGLMAPSTIEDHRDGFGTPFGLIEVPSVAHYTVVIETYPDGDALVDQDRIDSQVASWGAWLGQLGVDDGIVGASVTVETAPDSGVRLARMVDSNLDPDAPPFAIAIANELSGSLSAGSPRISTRIAITFSGRGFEGAGRDRGRAAMAEEIGNRLPVLLSSLGETGAGTSARPCTAQDIIDFTRTAYDPTVATQIEQSRADGGTGLTWADAGPAFAEDKMDRYVHDRAVSKTWQMYEAPKGFFYSTAMRRLVEPTTGVLRKRVTLLYRPVPAGKASEIVEKDINNAIWSNTQKKRASAKGQLQLKYAEKAAQEEASGAGLLRFGVLVTVTVANSDEFPRLDKVIPSLGNQARLRLREALGNHAVAFQAALPLGVVLSKHSFVPDEIREWM